MIGTFRKHINWLWYIIIAAMIFSFVYYFNPASKYSMGSSTPRATGNFGTIFGDPVTNDQLVQATAEAKIFYRLQSGDWPTTQAALERVDEIARTFLLVQAELRHNHIDVTPDAAARFTKQIVGLKPNEILTKDMLEEVLQKILAGSTGDVTANDFINFVHLSAGQQYLTAIFGMTGQLITPKEAESFYRRDNEPMLTELASIPASNYVAMIMPTTNEVEDFYSKRQAQYRVPEEIALNYVQFPVTNYMAAGDKSLATELGTNFDTKIDELYVQQDPSVYKDETGTNVLSAAAAKAKLKQQVRNKAALVEARKAAVEFANHLLDKHDEQHPFTQEDIYKTAKDMGLEVRSTAPFDEQTGPTDFDLPPKEVHTLFSLSNDDPDDRDKSKLYMASPLMNEKGVYVVGLKSRLPSHVLPLAQIRAQVVDDYRRAKSLELAHQAGQKFEDAVKAAASQNKSFEQLCQEQGLKVIKLPPFSMASNSIPEISDRAETQQIQSVAYNMPTGRMSPFVPTQEGGFILFVRQRLPIDEAKMQAQMPQLIARMREQREVEAFTQWLNREGQLHAVFPVRERNAAAG